MRQLFHCRQCSRGYEPASYISPEDRFFWTCVQCKRLVTYNITLEEIATVPSVVTPQSTTIYRITDAPRTWDGYHLPPQEELDAITERMREDANRFWKGRP